DISASPTGVLNDPHTRVDIRGQGRIIGLALPEQAAAASGLGQEISWSLAATTTRDGRAVDLTQLSARGAGVSLAGSGQLAPTGAIEGRFNLSIADLRPFSSILGHPLDGSVELEASAAREGSAGFRAELDGSAKELKTGFAAADALLGGSATLAGSVRRDEAGVLSAHRLDVAGAAGKLTGDARFDPSSHSLAAALAFDLPRLAPLSSALGMPVSGALSARLKVEGPLARLDATGDVEGGDISLAGTRLDRLHLVAHVPDLSDPKAALQGSLHAYGLDGTLALAAEPKGNSELVVPQLRLTAADSTLAGSLRMALDTGLVRGAVSGRAPNLARWSGVAGRPLAGTIEFAAGLDAREGQLLDLSLTGTGLAEGSGPSRVGIGRLALTARFADILRRPSGTGRVSLASVNFNGGGFTTAALELDAPRPGRFSFRGDAKGEPLTVAMAGDGGLEPGKLDLRLTRLSGSLGSDRLFLEQPVSLSRNGADLAFSGLALAWGPGRISGNGGVRGQSVSLALNAADLPIASGARLLGYHNASGTLSIAATAGGTLRAPQGRLAVNARGLTLSTADHSKLPRLGLAVDGNWNGRNLDLKGQVTGLKGDNINFAGAVPLVFTPAPLGISMPPAGRLALQLQGAGQLENLADLLPLGEDRVSGRFAADVVVGGTVASPAANGRLKLSDARYENFASGAVLTKMQAEVIGDRDRFALSSFSAADNAGGTLRAQGNVVLGGAAGPTAQLSATLTNFRVAARDEATATASGAVSISGPLTAPHVTAPLTINRAEISLPDSLPPNVVVLNVVETNNKAGKRQPPGTAGQPPALPMPLDITLDMPGNIFVRGHGLESEWRGKLAISGTSAAPNIKGSLTQVRGSIDLLGKTFTLTRGVITFDGSGKLDPVLDIVAESRASDITAQVNIGGSASAPRITLSSTPSVPKDEILSRVLFNRGVGQLSAAEGLQLAAAAGTLAGGGPGVLDRLRSGIGLDWFRLGSGAGGPASSTLNQTKTSGRGASNTALSAGKEIAPGVSVGVSQGLSPPTSKVTVDVEVRRHLTIQGEAGQAGTGIGLNYNFDY
ncbi:MAG: translocation/assembly module TamB domain-containing protein, partial [Alphaproteobacteria bacterium]|nr:translocation/assembly module TamB domain-containing protein [Alphaproteobacteria bacterium]